MHIFHTSRPRVVKPEAGCQPCVSWQGNSTMALDMTSTWEQYVNMSAAWILFWRRMECLSLIKVAEQHMLEALGHYLWLHQWATAEQRHIWHVVPKIHMAYHMSEHTRYLNPRYTWTFKGEDYVGIMSTMAHSCTFWLKRTRLSGKLCQKYLFCLHHR